MPIHVGGLCAYLQHMHTSVCLVYGCACRGQCYVCSGTDHGRVRACIYPCASMPLSACPVPSLTDSCFVALYAEELSVLGSDMLVELGGYSEDHADAPLQLFGITTSQASSPRLIQSAQPPAPIQAPRGVKHTSSDTQDDDSPVVARLPVTAKSPTNSSARRAGRQRKETSPLRPPRVQRRKDSPPKPQPKARRQARKPPSIQDPQPQAHWPTSLIACQDNDEEEIDILG